MSESREYAATMYKVLVSSKDYAKEDETGEFVDYVSLFEGEFDTLDEAKSVAFDILHKARAEDGREACYLGAFIDDTENKDRMWSIDETVNGFEFR